MSAILTEAERVLALHDPAHFDSTIDAAPESIEVAYAVEENEAWRAAYPSLEAFYAAHEERHPDIRLYGDARRYINTMDPLTSEGGTISQIIARLRERQGDG